MIPGIPTSYNGTRFRSRLEARWAAMFDLLAWSWEYEPLDLDGYIPDFIVKFPTPLLVEIKPITDPRGPDLEAMSKIELSGYRDWVVTLGAVLHEDTQNVQVGWMYAPHEPNIERAFVSWYRDHWTIVGTGEANDVRCRAGRCYPVDGFVHRGIHFDQRTQVIALWREAGNRVQWKRDR